MRYIPFLRALPPVCCATLGMFPGCGATVRSPRLLRYLRNFPPGCSATVRYIPHIPTFPKWPTILLLQGRGLARHRGFASDRLRAQRIFSDSPHKSLTDKEPTRQRRLDSDWYRTPRILRQSSEILVTEDPPDRHKRLECFWYRTQRIHRRLSENPQTDIED